MNRHREKINEHMKEMFYSTSNKLREMQDGATSIETKYNVLENSTPSTRRPARNLLPPCQISQLDTTGMSEHCCGAASPLKLAHTGIATAMALSWHLHNCSMAAPQRCWALLRHGHSNYIAALWQLLAPQDLGYDIASLLPNKVVPKCLDLHT